MKNIATDITKNTEKTIVSLSSEDVQKLIGSLHGYGSYEYFANYVFNKIPV